MTPHPVDPLEALLGEIVNQADHQKGLGMVGAYLPPALLERIRAALASPSVPPPQDAARWLKAQDKATAPPVLEEKAQDDRRPPPPAELVDALQDSAHIDTGRVRAARSVKHAAQETAALKEGKEVVPSAVENGRTESKLPDVPATLGAVSHLLAETRLTPITIGPCAHPTRSWLTSSRSEQPTASPPKAPAALPKEEVAPGCEHCGMEQRFHGGSAQMCPGLCKTTTWTPPIRPPEEQLFKEGSAAAPAPGDAVTRADWPLLEYRRRCHLPSDWYGWVGLYILEEYAARVRSEERELLIEEVAAHLDKQWHAGGPLLWQTAAIVVRSFNARASDATSAGGGPAPFPEEPEVDHG